MKTNFKALHFRASIYAGAVLFLLLSSLGNFLSGAAVIVADHWITDGEIVAMTATADTLYAGGKFEVVGPNRGSFAVPDPTDGSSAQDLPFIQGGTVYTIISDGASGWYVGGDFTTINGQARTSLARINSDGTLNISFNPPPMIQAVKALALDGGRLYVAGGFITTSGPLRTRLAAFDAITGAITAWYPVPNNEVRALAIDGGYLYAGGSFTALSGVPHSRLAKIDMGSVSGTPTAWDPGMSSPVEALALHGNRLFAGGVFSNVSTVPRSRLAAFDISGPDPVLTSFNIGVTRSTGAQVSALHVNGDQLAVGGFYTQIGGLNRDNFAVIDLSTDSVSSLNVKVDVALFNPQVYGLGSDSSNFYIGGSFHLISTTARHNAAKVSFGGVVTPWVFHTDTFVRAFCWDGSRLAVGGEFRLGHGVIRKGLAAFDQTGKATAWNPGVYPVDVRDVALWGSDQLLIAGGFWDVGGITRNYAASVDISGSTGWARAWNPNLNGYAESVAPHGSDVFVSGGFFQINGGAPKANFAKTNSLGTAIAFPAGSQQSFMEVHGDVLYRAGAGDPTDTVDAITGAAIPTGVTQWSAVRDIVQAGDYNYISGFSGAISRLGRMNLSQTVDTWNPAPNTFVYDMAVGNNRVYLAGVFNSIFSQSRLGIAAISNDGILTDFNPQSDPAGAANAVAVIGSKVYVGGWLPGADGLDMRNLQVYVDTDLIVGATPTHTFTVSATRTTVPNTPTRSPTVTRSATRTPSPTVTASPTVQASYTPTPTASRTFSVPLASSWCINTIAGSLDMNSGNGVDGLPAYNNPLWSPRTSFYDAADNLFIAEWAANKIRKIDPSGIITTVAGNGSNSSGGDGGLATAAQIYGPTYACLDPFGAMYISETVGRRIRKVDTSGIISTVLGNGSGGNTGDGGLAVSATVSGLQGIVSDSIGNIYFADATNHVVRRIDTAGIVTRFAGNASAGYSGDGGPATSARLNGPTGLGIGPGGELYIADFDNCRIRMVSGGIISTVAGNGTCAYTGDGGPATAASLNHPRALGFLPSGEILIGDEYNNVIRVFRPGGAIATWAGTGLDEQTGDGSLAINAGLFSPGSLAVRPSDGGVALADWYKHQVRLIAPGLCQTVTLTPTRTETVTASPSRTASVSPSYSPTATPDQGPLMVQVVPFWTVNGNVYALTATASTLYVGGSFTSISSPDGLTTLARSNLAAFDLTSGQPLAWAPDPDNAVVSFMLLGTDVYVGGDFTNIGGSARGRGARFDQATHTLQSWNPAANNRITSMSAYGGSIYLSGWFLSIGGQSRSFLAELDPVSAIVGPWSPAVNSSPSVVVADSSGVYVGGSFSTLGGASRANLGQVNYSGTFTTFNPNPNQDVQSLLLHNGYLYVGGRFTTISGQSRRSLAIYDAGTKALQSGTSLFASFDTVFAMSATWAKLRLGGALTQFNGSPRFNVASAALATGVADSLAVNLDGELRAVAVGGYNTFIGGFFTTVDSVPRAHLAAIYEGPAFTATPTPFQTSTVSPTHTVSPFYSPTISPTISPTFSQSPTFSVSPTFSASPSVSQTHSASPTPSTTPTVTLSATRTTTPSNSPTMVESAVPTPTVSPTAFRVDSGVEISSLKVAPNPNPRYLHVLLSGSPADLRIRFYSLSYSQLFSFNTGPLPSGWNRLRLPPDYYLLGNGLYYVQVTAQGADGQWSKAKNTRLVLIK